MTGDTASCTGVRIQLNFCFLLRGHSLALLILTHFLRRSTAAEIDTYSPEVKAVLSTFFNAISCNWLAQCGRQTLSPKGFHVRWIGAFDQIDGCFTVRHRWVVKRTRLMDHWNRVFDWWLRCLRFLLQANVYVELWAGEATLSHETTKGEKWRR